MRGSFVDALDDVWLQFFLLQILLTDTPQKQSRMHFSTTPSLDPELTALDEGETVDNLEIDRADYF
jgi:hypothetical protein